MNLRITIVTTLVLTAVIYTGIPDATAGVITTVDANVISWDNAGTTYYFYKGSYNNAVVQPEAFSDPGSLGTALSNDLNSPSANSEYTTTEFLFAAASSPSRPTASNISVTYVSLTPFFPYNYTSGGPINIHPDTTVWGTNTVYWASTTAPPTGTVPEPSTAIAMCMIGIVGFAGNRRRRRQVSAA